MERDLNGGWSVLWEQEGSVGDRALGVGPLLRVPGVTRDCCDLSCRGKGPQVAVGVFYRSRRGTVSTTECTSRICNYSE
jgi:hypothetical protein